MSIENPYRESEINPALRDRDLDKTREGLESVEHRLALAAIIKDAKATAPLLQEGINEQNTHASRLASEILQHPVLKEGSILDRTAILQSNVESMSGDLEHGLTKSVSDGLARLLHSLDTTASAGDQMNFTTVISRATELQIFMNSKIASIIPTLSQEGHDSMRDLRKLIDDYITVLTTLEPPNHLPYVNQRPKYIKDQEIVMGRVAVVLGAGTIATALAINSLWSRSQGKEDASLLSAGLWAGLAGLAVLGPDLLSSATEKVAKELELITGVGSLYQTYLLRRYHFDNPTIAPAMADAVEKIHAAKKDDVDMGKLLDSPKPLTNEQKTQILDYLAPMGSPARQTLASMLDSNVPNQKEGYDFRLFVSIVRSAKSEEAQQVMQRYVRVGASPAAFAAYMKNARGPRPASKNQATSLRLSSR